jgi:hypothetical protein
MFPKRFIREAIAALLFTVAILAATPIDARALRHSAWPPRYVVGTEYGTWWRPIVPIPPCSSWFWPERFRGCYGYAFMGHPGYYDWW